MTDDHFCDGGENSIFFFNFRSFKKSLVCCFVFVFFFFPFFFANCITRNITRYQYLRILILIYAPIFLLRCPLALCDRLILNYSLQTPRLKQFDMISIKGMANRSQLEGGHDYLGATSLSSPTQPSQRQDRIPRDTAYKVNCCVCIHVRFQGCNRLLSWTCGFSSHLLP